MKLAWFAPQPNAVALELGRTHHVDLFDAARAHDFVWRHVRSPYDLTVVELADSPAHAYVWPYLFHDPGIVLLKATSLQQSRTAALTVHQRRQDLRAERAFGGPSLLRAPLTAARLVVVHDEALARELHGDDPDLDIRILPVGVTAPSVVAASGIPRVRFDPPDAEAIERAAARAREAGARIETMAGLDGLGEDDIAIALEWPPTGAPPTHALRAMAAGLPAIVFETETVAAWPTLDPQTWQPRGYLATDPPIAVSIDPRDEEHSLMLAMKRLSADPILRRELGASAARWTARHASAADAAAAWEPVLREAAVLPPRIPASGLPAHLTADGTERTRALLAEIGARVDFLEP